MTNMIPCVTRMPEPYQTKWKVKFEFDGKLEDRLVGMTIREVTILAQEHPIYSDYHIYQYHYNDDQSKTVWSGRGDMMRPTREEAIALASAELETMRVSNEDQINQLNRQKEVIRGLLRELEVGTRKANTSDLIGPPLDYAVAKALGIDECMIFDFDNNPEIFYITDSGERADYTPSKSWDIAGLIIEKEEICLKRKLPHMPGEDWEASGSPTAKGCCYTHLVGPTPLVAAMRCFVYAHLGKEIELPEEFDRFLRVKGGDHV